MKVKHIFSLLIVYSAMLVLNSCYYDNEEELYSGTSVCDTTNNVYNGTIQAIIARSCVGGCHEQAVGSAGIILDSYVNLKNEVMNGQVMCAIRHEGCSPMPKNQGKMNDCDISNIQRWIDKGYPEN